MDKLILFVIQVVYLIAVYYLNYGVMKHTLELQDNKVVALDLKKDYSSKINMIIKIILILLVITFPRYFWILFIDYITLLAAIVISHANFCKRYFKGREYDYYYKLRLNYKVLRNLLFIILYLFENIEQDSIQEKQQKVEKIYSARAMWEPYITNVQDQSFVAEVLSTLYKSNNSIKLHNLIKKVKYKYEHCNYIRL